MLEHIGVSRFETLVKFVTKCRVFALSGLIQCPGGKSPEYAVQSFNLIEAMVINSVLSHYLHRNNSGHCSHRGFSQQVHRISRC